MDSDEQSILDDAYGEKNKREVYQLRINQSMLEGTADVSMNARFPFFLRSMIETDRPTSL